MGHRTRPIFLSLSIPTTLKIWIDSEIHGSYKEVSCVEALLHHFDHWLAYKVDHDHLQVKYAKDLMFDSLKEQSVERLEYEMCVDEDQDHHSYKTYFSLAQT